MFVRKVSGGKPYGHPQRYLQFFRAFTMSWIQVVWSNQIKSGDIPQIQIHSSYC